MSTLKFTPGPWEVNPVGPDHDRIYDILTTRGEREGTARLIVAVEGDRPNAEANANLIAAAPDLYEALRLIADEADHSTSGRDIVWVRTHARAALRKVDGGNP